VKKEYPVLSKETAITNSHNSPILWDEPLGFCPLSIYIPTGYVVEILGSTGISSAMAACQVPMRKHATIFKTKQYSMNNHRKNNLHFISENVRNTACHIVVVRKLNEIATFYEFKHRRGRRFTVDHRSAKKFPLVLWTGLHCTSSTMPTNLYVNKILPLTNSSTTRIKIDYSAPLSFLPRSLNILESGYSIYYVYIKERGGCSPNSLMRWFYKGPIASTSQSGNLNKLRVHDETLWNDVADSKDLIHLVVVTKNT
jgi:hypothetical protein